MQKKEITSERAILIALLLAGLLLRIWSAWMKRYMPNPDYGIAALMSRHIALGKSWPVFFYGQPYMGSLEPAFSAMLCKLFGISSFMVSLGTALLSWLCLPFIYAWARDTAGTRKAGWAALLFCLYGTDTWHHYGASPRGGYALMMLCGVALLWLTGFITTKLRQNKPVHVLLYVALGLAGGIAWWTLQLAIVFLAACSLTFIILLRRRLLHYGFVVSFIFFIIGSLPWWLWNATHHWATFAFKGSWGSITFAEGWAGFLHVLKRMLEPSTAFHPAVIFTFGLCIVAFFGFLLHTIIVVVKKRKKQQAPLLLAWATLLFMVLFFCRSHFALLNATRYVLPLYPVCAVILGILTCQLTHLLPYKSGWIPLIVVALLQIPFPLSGISKQVEESKSMWLQGKRLATEATEQGWDVVYADFIWNWLNFASEEKVTVVTPTEDRYAPYTIHAATAVNPGYLHNPQHIRTFLQDTDSTYEQWAQHGLYMIYNIRPSVKNPLQQAHIEPVDPALQRLTDGNLDTGWKQHIPSGASVTLMLNFRKPILLQGIRLLSRDKQFPYLMGIDIMNEKGESTPLYDIEPFSPWFWSGQKAYCDGLQAIKQFDFPEQIVHGLKFICKASDKTPVDVLFSEIILLSPAEQTDLHTFTPINPEQDLRLLKAWLSMNNPDRLYAPRFVSEQLYQDASITCELIIPAYFKRSVNDLPSSEEPAYVDINLSGHPAFLVNRSYAQRTQDMLIQAGAGMDVIDMGPWILIDTKEVDNPDPGEPSLLYWTEAGCFHADSSIFARQWAAALYRTGQQEEKAGNLFNAIQAWAEALGHWPAYPEATIALKPFASSSDIAATALMTARQAITPTIDIHATYSKGIHLLGISLSTNSVTHNQSFDITYYWQCPAELNPDPYAVFVHIEQDKHRFQDDRVFLEYLDPRIRTHQPTPDIFAETRTITIPADIPAGNYSIKIGIYNRISGKRLPVHTDLPVKQRALILEGVLTVR